MPWIDGVPGMILMILIPTYVTGNSSQTQTCGCAIATGVATHESGLAGRKSGPRLFFGVRIRFGAIQVLRNADGGGGGFTFSGEKRCEGVRFNDKKCY